MNIKELIQMVKIEYAQVLLQTGINDTETLLQLKPRFDELGLNEVSVTVNVKDSGDDGLCVERNLRALYQDCELSFGLYATEEVV